MKHQRKLWGAMALVAGIAITAVLAIHHEPASPEDLAGLLVAASNANASHDIELERKLLEQAEGLEGSDTDRAEVQCRLAVLDWKYQARFDPARKRLRSATSGPEPALAWLALARLEQAAGQYDVAFAAAGQALESSVKFDETRSALLAQADAAVEKAVGARLMGQSANDEMLREGFARARQLVNDEPGQLVASRRMLQAALILGDGDAALDAWRSYFHVGPDGTMPNAVADAGRRLEKLLPGGLDAASSRPSSRVALVLALAESRFYTEAALVALDPASGKAIEDPRVSEAVAYADFLRRVREVTDEYYRKTSIGNGSAKAYYNALRAEARRLISEAGFEEEYGSTPTIEDLQDLTRDQFGAMFITGETAGYKDAHYGHIVVDERRTVEQYERTAGVRLVQLDNMISNGFQSWAWEGGAQHGGWGRSTLIVQIRPAYMNEPLHVWRQLTDEGALAELLEEIETETAADDARAAADPYGYFPGVTKRMQYAGVSAMLDRLRASGLEDDALRIAFISETQRVVQESSIFAHEGRHAIDAAGAAPNAPTWQLEFNAKLSEVAFAPEPRLALGGVFSSTIGSHTPHGRANSKIMKGLVRWMDQHRAEIAELDGERPLLPQFDLLSDDQMREAFRSMDPLVR